MTHRRAKTHGNAALLDMLLRHLEHVAAFHLALRADVRIGISRIEAGNALDAHIAPCFVARQGIVASYGVDADDGIKRLAELPHVRRKLHQRSRKSHEHGIWRGLGVARLQIFKRLSGIVGDPRPAAGANRYSARKGFFLDKKNACPCVMGLDRADRPCKAISHDHDVKLIGHVGSAFSPPASSPWNLSDSAPRGWGLSAIEKSSDISTGLFHRSRYRNAAPLP